VSGIPVMRPIRDVTKGDAPPPLDYGFMHPIRETLFYARGGAGKGVIAAYFAAQDTKRGKRVGILAYEPHPDEWFRRIEGFGGNLDLADIALPVSEEQGWLRGPIWTQAEEIKAYCAERRIRRLYVDSLMPATKADGDSALSDPSIPDDFYGATRTIGIPSLILGHLAGGSRKEDLWKPWGSVYWVNYARIAWSAWYDPQEQRVELRNQKRNVYRAVGPYAVDWAWADELGDGETPATLTFAALDRGICDRACDQLATIGPMPFGDLLTAVNKDGEGEVKKQALSNALGRSKRVEKRDDGMYQLVGQNFLRIARRTAGSEQ
jgi:hypothetical protein